MWNEGKKWGNAKRSDGMKEWRVRGKRKDKRRKGERRHGGINMEELEFIKENHGVKMRRVRA